MWASHFGTVYFDRPQTELLEKLALKEGLVSADNLVMDGVGPTPLVNTAQLLSDTDRILDAIMLFDKIDSSLAVYRWDKMMQMDIVPPSPKAHRVDFSEDISANTHLRDDPIYQRCKHSTGVIFKDNSHQIIKLASTFSLDWLKSFGASSTYIRDFSRLANLIFSCAVEELSDKNSETETELTRTRFRPNNIVHEMFTIDPLILVINSLFQSYVEGLYFSTMDSGSFSSWICPRRSGVKNPEPDKSILDVLCTVRFDFGRQILLPRPATITEAVEYKELNQVKRLREVLNEWCFVLSEGKEKLEKKIHSDVALATTDLMKLKRIREFRRS